VATIYRCDRCDRESEKRDDIKEVSFPRMDSSRWNFLDDASYDTTQQTKEICKHCCKELHMLLDKLPRAAQG
jgi:hypothetical protein